MKRLFLTICIVIFATSMWGCEKKTHDTYNSNVEMVVDEANVMSYKQYIAADLETVVTIDTYVQAKQRLSNGRTSLYTQDMDGAYFIYNMKCSREDYDKLVEGQRVLITGLKNEWSGEVEIWNATMEMVEGNYIAEPIEISSFLDDPDIVDYQNRKITMTDMIVEASKDEAGNERGFIYSWDGTGSEGDDIYFNASIYGHTYSFTVESALCDENSEAYKQAQKLEIGDVVDMSGFLYWFEGVNPHITSIDIK